jgi:hypothetical protein
VLILLAPPSPCTDASKGRPERQGQEPRRCRMQIRRGRRPFARGDRGRASNKTTQSAALRFPSLNTAVSKFPSGFPDGDEGRRPQLGQGRSPYWLKLKNQASAAVRREAEEEWGR